MILVWSQTYQYYEYKITQEALEPCIIDKKMYDNKKMYDQKNIWQ